MDKNIINTAQICTNVLAHFKDGQNWINNFLSNDEKDAPIQKLKRLSRQLRRLKKSCLNNPAIAVFGPSQVGKSYLISNLVRQSHEDDLKIIDPITGERISFIQDMNPFGGQESTGTVTRFTTKTDGVKGFRVRLLTVKDLICIIINGYFLDIKGHDYVLSMEELTDKYASISSYVSEKEYNILSEDDIYEIKDYIYITLGLKNHVIIKNLSDANYWKKIADIAHQLPINAIVDAFSCLWGNLPFINGLFTKLLRGLQIVGFQEEIICNKNALTPNTKTILDVKRVKEIYDLNSQNNDQVSVKWAGEHSAAIDRRLLSALTAEIELCLDKQNEGGDRKFLNYADVLDFPGARSREHIPEAVFKANNEENKLQLFVRGKVAYLFDLYNQDFGISTLLYCMDEGNNEVQEIPKLLHNWLSDSVGNSANEREKRLGGLREIINFKGDTELNPLLVVLTKFDIELQGKNAEKEGNPSTHNGKWIARIEENFRNFMQRPVNDKWITNWRTEQDSFKNIFPLRNPSFSRSFFNCDENGVETGVNPMFRQKIQDMQESFLSHPTIQKHIHNPLRTWNEFATINNTGIEYIIEALTPTSRPEIKYQLIKEAIKTAIQKGNRVLDDYYNSDDLDEMLKKAKRKAAKSFLYLNVNITKQNKFGNLLSELQLSENEAYHCYHSVINAPIQKGNTNISSKRVGLNDFPIELEELLEPFGIDKNVDRKTMLNQLAESLQVDRSELAEIITEATGSTIDEIFGMESDIREEVIRDNAMAYVEEVLSKWNNKVKDLNQLDENESLNLIVDELIKAKSRVNLKKVLYNAVKEEVDNFAVNNTYDVVARITYQVINKFTNTFGWHYVKEEERPSTRAGVPIFKTDNLDVSKVVPSIDNKFPGKKIQEHWAIGSRETFVANVLKETNIKDTKALAQNQVLGTIINGIKQQKDGIQ